MTSRNPFRSCIGGRLWRATLVSLVGLLMALLAAGGAARFVAGSARTPETGPVSVIDARTAWVGLDFTQDGGASWRSHVPVAADRGDFIDMPSGAEPTFFLTARRGWLSGRTSIWMTDDGGETWRSQMAGHFHVITFFKGHGWLGAGDERLVRNYVTSDDGNTWAECGAPWRLSEVAPFNAGMFIDARTGWITVARYDERRRVINSGVARTTDGGCTWETLWWQRPGSVERLGEVQFTDRSFGWLTMISSGALLSTENGGEHWGIVGTPEWIKLWSSYLLDQRHGWILGNTADGPALYTTSDSGRHWTSVSFDDFLAGRRLGREVPPLWGDAFLAKARATRR